MRVLCKKKRFLSCEKKHICLFIYLFIKGSDGSPEECENIWIIALHNLFSYFFWRFESVSDFFGEKKNITFKFQIIYILSNIGIQFPHCPLL